MKRYKLTRPHNGLNEGEYYVPESKEQENYFLQVGLIKMSDETVQNKMEKGKPKNKTK